MRNKVKLFKIITICCLLLLIIPTGCSNNDSIEEIQIAALKSEQEEQFSKFKTKYNLKPVKNKNVIRFNSIDEAEAFFEKLKNRKKEKYVLKFNKNDFSSSPFSFSTSKYKVGKGFKLNRFKTGFIEEIAWTSTHNAGLLSNFVLDFNTTGNYVIDSGSINLYTTGINFGYSYEQTSVTMVDNDSFIVKGTVTWGIDVGNNIPSSYSYTERVRCDIDWEAGTITWTQL